MEDATRVLIENGANVVVWPEGGTGAAIFDSIRRLETMDTNRTALIVAGDLYRDGVSVAATATLHKGQLVHLHEKVREVPGMEARPVASSLETFLVQRARVASLICYASTWRWVFARLQRIDTEFLIVQSDATSFVHTSLARLHWHLTALLAIERRIPTFFVSRNGGVHWIVPRLGLLDSAKSSSGTVDLTIPGPPDRAASIL